MNSRLFANSAGFARPVKAMAARLRPNQEVQSICTRMEGDGTVEDGHCFPVAQGGWPGRYRAIVGDDNVLRICTKPRSGRTCDVITNLESRD